jgi:hypothetical protein
MRTRNARRLGNGRMRDRDVLDADRTDPFAPGLYQILATVRNLHEAIVID